MKRIAKIIPSLLFSFFIVFGRSFAAKHSWELIFGSAGDFILSALLFIFLFFIFYFVISWLFDFLDRHIASPKSKAKSPKETFFSRFLSAHPRLARPIHWYLNKLDTHPILTIFLTIVIANLPLYIMTFPGLLMGDSLTQFFQAGGINTLTNDHPVLHTLIIRVVLKLGSVIGNNPALFLYTIAQSFALSFALAFALSTVLRRTSSKTVVLITLLFYLFHPRLYTTFFWVTKDIFFMAVLILFITLLFRIFLAKEETKPFHWVGLALSIIGIILFRNEGIYLVVISLLACLFIKSARKPAFLLLILAVATTLSVKLIILPVTGAHRGSIGEMLSIPFQQTARYVRDAKDDVTPAEQEAIAAVLDYDRIGNLYHHERSDPVKNTFHGDNEGIKTYLKTWFKMFWKHPDIYIQATMDSYYQYFYPSLDGVFVNEMRIGVSLDRMKDINEVLGTDYSVAEPISSFGQKYQVLRNDLAELPVISIILQPSLYIWILLLLIFYAIYRKCGKAIILCTPAIVQLAVFITCPANGWFGRYEYPMLFYLPIVLALSYYLFTQQNTKRGKIKL